MARSKYIYVVVAVGSYLPVTVFTVKYECLKWVAQSAWDLDHINMYRYPDGAPYMSHHVDMVHMPWDREEMEELRAEHRALRSLN